MPTNLIDYFFKDEKKYLKMELVNRETNFNKVFTNAPSSNVGVMNPLSYNTKFVSLRYSNHTLFTILFLGSSTFRHTSSVPSRMKSQSPRPSKLEPLVTHGDTPHDLALNTNKPLLPKRFVK